MKPGRPSRSEKGPGEQKTIWFSPENLARINTQRAKAGPTTSFNEAVNALVESGAPDALETSTRRLQEIRELRKIQAEKDKLIAKLEQNLANLKTNSVAGQESQRRLELDLLSVHPKSRSRVAKQLGIQET